MARELSIITEKKEKIIHNNKNTPHLFLFFGQVAGYLDMVTDLFVHHRIWPPLTRQPGLNYRRGLVKFFFRNDSILIIIYDFSFF